MSASTFASKWRGDSEKLVRLLFEMARFYAPSTVFLDEVDALGGRRSVASDSDASLRVKSELLVQMDGLAPSQTEANGVVTVLAATNFPWNLDDALRRRFEKRIYIPLPDVEQRRALFEINTRGILLAGDVDLDVLARKTEVRERSGWDVGVQRRRCDFDLQRRGYDVCAESRAAIEGQWDRGGGTAEAAEGAGRRTEAESGDTGRRGREVTWRRTFWKRWGKCRVPWVHRICRNSRTG